MTCGVYTLVHMPSNMFYIGSSRNVEDRAVEWTRNIHNNSEWTSSDWRPGSAIPKRFMELVSNTQAREWEIFLLEEVSDPNELPEKEKQQIVRALTLAPDRCLNTTTNTYRRPIAQQK